MSSSRQAAEPGPTPDGLAVEAANTELYRAFEEADVDAMAALWDGADDPAAAADVVCVHPGWPMLTGRSQVLRSWSAIMAGTAYIQFFLTDVQVRVAGDTAVVTCTENVLTAISESEGTGAAVVSTNVFRRRADGWRIQVHHGSPVLGSLDDE
ncbi:MAG: nuclear transport factor 2 family protein [Mycobacteriales bacterium]|nr:nuclear transport factor 2 family protein [Mycobacteriales bacterium]